MKKLLLLVAFGITVSVASANDSKDLFSYDKQAVNEAFGELNTLETQVNAGEMLISADAPAHNGGVSLAASASGYAPLGIPSFVWGCVGGIAGVAVVHFIDEDKDETKMALWGCVAQSVVGTIVYVIAFAGAASQAGAI